MIRKIFYLKLIFLFAILLISGTVNAQAEKAALDGSFITGDLCYSWDNERWQQEFTALKNVGMHYIIIQAVAESYPGKVTKTIYPSSLPNTEIEESEEGSYPDVVDACLRNAETAEIKVFIGIDLNDKWWDLYANDSTWLYNQMDLDNTICDELWDKYKNKYPNAFYGWYWAYEVENLHFQTNEQQKVLIKAMNKQLDHLSSTNRKLPFMWCPFMNSELGAPGAYETMWKNVLAGLHTTAGDIFCPQDCVGAGGLKLSEIASWFSALRRAVDTKPGLEMWADVETFKPYGNSFISATMGRIVSQLKIEQPYVDNYISWNYTYYDSPNKMNSGFHITYSDYLKNDSLESIKPNTPSKFTAAPLSGNVILNWEMPSDNIGICGYNIYRNGKMIIKKQVPNNVTDAEASTNAIDAKINSNTDYSYQIEAYDFAGNVSILSNPIEVSTKNYENVSLGSSYTVSEQPSNPYPDTGNKKLTDGKTASQAYYADPQWVGFVNIDTLNVTIDLEQNRNIRSFIANYLFDPQPAVFLPKQVNISLSSDNVTFTNIGFMIDATPQDTISNIHKYYYALTDSQSARYVRFNTITSGSAWLFVDEYQVFGTVISGVNENSSIIPKVFSLSNNYPNPFNPTTTVNFTLPQTVKANISIYNVLGQKVLEVINQELSAGLHSVTIDASSLSSGMYFYKLQTNKYSKTMKMMLLK